MHISCPHCLAKHEIEAACGNTSLLCHRCGIKFPVPDRISKPDEQESSPVDTYDPIVPEDIETSGQTGNDTPEDVAETAKEAADISSPHRKKARIWPWLMIMLTLIFSAGYWLQKDAWLDNRWFRSTAINLGYPLPLRDKDWRVLPDSIQAEWITRDDDSKALLIKGRVKNLLTSALPVPAIEITFFSDINPGEQLGSQRLTITLQPGKRSLSRSPYTAPELDKIPVTPNGEREFVLLIESPPENTGDFTLTARVQ
jgi:hypothetical protein